MDQRTRRQMLAILARAAAFGLALAILVVLMRLMGPGTRAVAVGGLFAAVVLWGGILMWSASDARRSPALRQVLITWVGALALLVCVYVAAALLFAGSYAQEMALPEIVMSALIPGSLCLAVPAALGIALGTAQRAKRS